MDVSGELMENNPRRQLYRGHHGKRSDRYLRACGELLSDVRVDKCVSRSVLPLTPPFASSVPLVLPLSRSPARRAASPGPQ